MALHAVTIWQVDPKGQWVSTFGVADIAFQRTGRSSRFVWSAPNDGLAEDPLHVACPSTRTLCMYRLLAKLRGAPMT